MKVLVVFYSRDGHTRELGHRIAAALHADIEEIADRVKRRGIRGYLRSGRDAWFERRVQIAAPVRDPASYDLVVVGSPVWCMSLSSPVRTYLQDHRAELRDVAFFCTLGGSGAQRVLAQMQHVSGKRPVATLAVTEHQLRQPDLPVAVRAFVYKLRMPRHAAA